MRARGKVQIECSCCGVFSQSNICPQCKAAGCGLLKKGQKCLLRNTGSSLQVLPNLAGAVTGLVMHAAGKAIRKLDSAAAAEFRKVHRVIEEAQL
jgi:hypothetical protein